jgi:hypothetical protein
VHRARFDENSSGRFRLVGLSSEPHQDGDHDAGLVCFPAGVGLVSSCLLPLKVGMGIDFLNLLGLMIHASY